MQGPEGPPNQQSPFPLLTLSMVTGVVVPGISAMFLDPPGKPAGAEKVPVIP
jgi:hypothetical protein